MEKRLVTQLTVLVVVLTLVVALGAAFWRSSYRLGGGETEHHHNHHSLEFFQRKTRSALDGSRLSMILSQNRKKPGGTGVLTCA